MHVGIALTGGAAWLGGAAYIENLLCAIESLPASERPLVSLVEMTEDQRAQFLDISGNYLRIRGYPRLSGNGWVWRGIVGRTPLRQLVGEALREAAAARIGRDRTGWLRKRRVQVLFPCTTPPGPGFALPWIGWYPDFQHKWYPGFFSVEEVLRRDDWARALAREATLIVASSETVKDDFERFFPEASGRVEVLRFCSALHRLAASEEDGSGREKETTAEPYVLVANQFWRHKNHRTVFEAARLLRDEGRAVRVVCTGALRDYRWPEYGEELLAFRSQYRLEEQIILTGPVSRVRLAALFRGARVVLQPSLFEGWSTVIEDARAFGCPLLVSDLPVHREQAPEGSRFFEATDAESLAEHLWSMLRTKPEDGNSLERLVDAGEARLREFGRAFVRIARLAAAGEAPSGSLLT